VSQLFQPTFLGSSNAGIWTMPASAASTSELKGLTLLVGNKTSAARLVTLYAFDAGSASLANAILYNHPVPPNDFIYIAVPEISGSSAKIQGYCDVADSVSVAAIGGEINVP